MNSREFEKTIVFEELAKINDSEKFMFKSYLSCLLKGGKIRDNCFIYNVGETPGSRVLPEFGALRTRSDEIEARKKGMIEFFKQIKKQGYWTITETISKDFDENGNLCLEEPPATISRTQKITTVTTYFLDDKNDIRSMKKGDLKCQ